MMSKTVRGVCRAEENKMSDMLPMNGDIYIVRDLANKNKSQGANDVYERSILNNGVRVLSEFVPYVRSATIGLWVKTGSSGETSENNGIGHFIEHMLFKGTERRSAREIAEEIDAVGGQLNAFTSKEYTCFYAKVLDQHLPLAVDVLADMFLHSLFDPVEIEKEKGVVIEEIKMYEDSPDELVQDELARAVYGDRSLGLNILGTKDTVGSLSRDDIISYMSRFYGSERLIISSAGNVPHEKIVKLAETYFHDLPRGAGETFQTDHEMAFRHIFRDKDTEQIHICIGLPGLPWNHPDRYALYLTDAILGGGMSSRLFQELREERGLVYSTYSYHASYENTGVFVIYAAASPYNGETVLALIKEIIQDFRTKGPSPEELSRAREQLKGSLLLSLESTSNRMSRLAKMEMFDDRLYTPEEVIGAVDRVQMDDIMRIIRKIAGFDELSLAIIGPDVEKSQKRLLDSLYS